MNWNAVIGNTIVAFCTAAIGINLAGVPSEINAAFYVAIITAFLALGKELQEESANPPKISLTHALLF